MTEPEVVKLTEGGFVICRRRMGWSEYLSADPDEKWFTRPRDVRKWCKFSTEHVADARLREYISARDTAPNLATHPGQVSRDADTYGGGDG